MYITYSRTYYKEKNGEKKIAYCADQDLDGVGWLPGEAEGYNAHIEKRITDERLWRVYKNGFPYSTPETLGVETEDDAYLATKQAAYFIISNKSLEEVETYFRAGQEAINGQDLDEIQRRGEKVKKAIYKLVKEGYYGTDKMTYINDAIITSVDNFTEEMSNNKCYQQFKIPPSSNKIKYEFTAIKNAPEGSFIGDLDGNPKLEFYSGETFKLLVPTNKIKSDYDIEITYKKTLENYPMYYAKSDVSGNQNYIVLSNSIEEKYGEIKYHITGNISFIKFKKTDKETDALLEGVRFKVENSKGEFVGEATTDRSGIAELKNLYPDTYKITEVETNTDYVLKKDPIYAEVNYRRCYMCFVSNMHKKGNLKIIKTDKDDERKLANVEFDLINSNNKVESHLITDENGEAYAVNINTGEYTLKETKTNEDYVLNDSEIKVFIDENKTNEINVQNEKEKGKIKIVKTSKDKNVINHLEADSPIPNVKFGIYDEEQNLIQELSTDDKGEALSNNLVKGKYKIKEIDSGEWYLLNNEEYDAEIKENGQVVTVKIYNISKDPKVYVNKIGPESAEEGKEVEYKFDIKNTGNVELSKFVWYDFLPYEYSKISKFSSGTFSQDKNYNIYYSTNKKSQYMILQKNLNTKKNNYIDLTKIFLEKDENITSIKMDFGDVDVGFTSEEQPTVYLKVNERINNNVNIVNETILEGYHNNYKVCDESFINTLIKAKTIITKKLPRTGY